MITGFSLIISLSTLSVWEQNKAINITKAILTHPFVVTNTVRDIRVDVRSLWTMTNEAVYQDIYSDDVPHKMSNTELKIEQEFKLLRNRYLGKQTDIDDIENTYRQLRLHMHEALAIRMASNTQKAAKFLEDNKAKQTYDQLSKEVNVVIEFAMNKAKQLSGESDGELNANIRQEVILSILIIIGGFIVYMLLVRSIKKEFDEVNSILEKIEHNDLQKASISNNNFTEFKSLKFGINNMVDSISKFQRNIEEKNIELNSAKKFLDFALQASGEGVWEWNLQTGEIKVNAIFEKMLGYEEGEWGKSEENMLKHTKPEQFNKSMKLFESHLKGLIPFYESEFEMQKKSREWIWVQSRGKIIDWKETGEPLIISGTHTDITQRKHYEEELNKIHFELEASYHVIQEAEESYRGLFNSILHAVYIQDLNGNFIDVNHGAELMYGYNREEFIGKTPGLISAPDKNDMQKLSLYIHHAIEGNPQRFEFWGMRKNGNIFPKDVSIVKGKYFGKDVLIAVGVDITRQKQLEEKLQMLVSEEMDKRIEKEHLLAQESVKAMTDALTGIPNRRYFDETFKNECNRAIRGNTFLSLIMIDIDFFKNYNDAYGHSEGDACLIQVANRLEDSMGRGSDFVSRYGGEEFVVILPATDLNGAKNIANKLKEAIENLNILHAYSRTSNHVTISLGCASLKIENEGECKKLLILADEMLYKAKGAGRNRVYSEDI